MTASPGSYREYRYAKSILFRYRTEEDADVKPYVNPVDVNWQWVNLTSEHNYIRSTLRNMLDDKLRWLIRVDTLEVRETFGGYSSET